MIGKSFKVFVTIAFLLLPLFFRVTSAEASNFSSSFSVNYDVRSNGITHTTFHITLTNLTSQYYAASYTLSLGFTDMSNLSASDGGGSIVPTVKKTVTGEDVHFEFNKKALGKGAKQPFTFSFDTRDIASLNGAVWEVNIPGLLNKDDFTDFTVTVGIPQSFGTPMYVKPAIGSDKLTFTKDQLGKSGVSLAFGQSQTYAFHLVYHLENKQIFPVKSQVALPPNTSYQEVEIDHITPKPSNVIEDQDGNWLAEYTLMPSQKIAVTVDGDAFLHLHPTQQILSEEEVAMYTKEQPYWQVQDDNIKKLALQLKSAEAIYAYVVGTLHYDFARVTDTQERLGAKEVLQNPSSAVCLEFTDLFIALARAAGIPAREVDGYAYTQNSKQRPLSLVKEVLHAWPEYYDSSHHEWVMVDPTWENTTGGVDYFHTFDFDHVALVVKGVSSTSPIPAGGYKTQDSQNSKDVTMRFDPDTYLSQPKVTVASTIPDTVMAGFPVTADVLLTNAGNVVTPEQKIIINSSILRPQKQVIMAKSIPPFGSLMLPVYFSPTAFLTKGEGTVTIQIAGKSLAKTLVVSAFTPKAFVYIVGGIIAILIIGLLIASTRPWRLFV